MAPRNKKIRSFSPYQYNIQYAKPGRGPTQVAKPYVKTASATENEYVVTKLSPKFFTFLENSFYYTISDDCEIQFNKLVSSFKIRTNKRLKEYESTNVLESKIYCNVIEVNKNSGIQYYWKSKKTISVNHNMNSMVDFIALLNDSEYLKCCQTMISDKIIEIHFPREFKDSDKITIILFQLSSNFKAVDNIVSSKIYTNDEIIDDDIKDILAIDNKFGNSNLFPIVFDSSNKSYCLQNYDIAPSYIAFKKSSISSLKQYEDEINVHFLNANNIKNENPSISENKLYDENINYKNAIDSINSLKSKINKLKKLNYEYDIERVVVYYLNQKYVKYDIFYNMENFHVKWISKNEVQVNHNLNGNVLLLFDGNNFYDYTIYKLDQNHIIIKFLNNIPDVCSLRLYKVN